MGNVDSTFQSFERLTTGEKRDLFQRLLLGSAPISGDAIKVYRKNRNDIIHARRDMDVAKANFRRLSKLVHPDKWANARATEVFQIMNDCFCVIEDRDVSLFAFLETPLKMKNNGFDAPYVYDAPPWEKLWGKTLEVCLEDQDDDELEGEALAEFVISEACKLACEDSVKNCHMDLDKGVEGYFEALEPDDARRAITIVSMLRGKISRRARDKCPYELVKETIASQRPSCMYKRRHDNDPDYTLDEFYKEFPDMRPSWWPRGMREGGAKDAPPPSRHVPANVKSFKPRSFAEWMDGRKRVERERGHQSTNKRRAGPSARGPARAPAPKSKPPPRRRARCVFVDDEAEAEDDDEEEEEEEDEEEEDEIEEDADDLFDDVEEEVADISTTARKRLRKMSISPLSRSESTCSSSTRAPVKGKIPLRNADIRNFFVRRAATVA
eukprot:jgi/Mesvir1/16601/Mv10136-RA.1